MPPVRAQAWLVTPDPLDGVEIPSDAEAVRIHVLTAREGEIYFNAARKHQNLYDLGRLMIQQGCRPEEFLGLQKTAVDLERGTFRIVSGKSKAAKRTLTMTRETRGILARRVQGISPWIFASPKTEGHFLKVNNPHATVLKATGLSFVLYDLRHTFATRAAEQGMPSATLAAILGHGELRSISNMFMSAAAMADAMKAYDAYQRASSGPVDSVETRDLTRLKVN